MPDGFIEARRSATDFHRSASNNHQVPWKRIDPPTHPWKRVNFLEIAKHRKEDRLGWAGIYYRIRHSRLTRLVRDAIYTFRVQNQRVLDTNR